jgi:hypothetical protein
MVYEINLNATIGEVVGYIPWLNPFSMMARMVVRINDKTVRIPIDHRQVKFIEKEYPAGSMVMLEFDGCWRIRSHMAPVEFTMDGMSESVYY